MKLAAIVLSLSAKWIVSLVCRCSTYIFLYHYATLLHLGMAIEVDGIKYHAEGSRQAERDAMKNSVLDKCGIPILRIRTNESGEETRIISVLRDVV